MQTCDQTDPCGRLPSGSERPTLLKGKLALFKCWYLTGLELHLASLKKSSPADLASGPQFVGNNIVHPTAKIGKDCKIGPNVSIGIECEIGDGARITSSVLLHRVHVSICTQYPSVNHRRARAITALCSKALSISEPGISPQLTTALLQV